MVEKVRQDMTRASPSIWISTCPFAHVNHTDAEINQIFTTAIHTKWQCALSVKIMTCVDRQHEYLHFA